MLFVLAIIGLTLGATAIQLAPEVAGEAIAMYIVEPPGDGGYGASFDPNDASENPAITPSGESSVYADPVFSSSGPVMAAAIMASATVSLPAPATVDSPESKDMGQIATDTLSSPQKGQVRLGSASDQDTLQHQDLQTEISSHQTTELSAPGHESAPSSLQLALMREKPRVNSDGTIFLPITSQRAFGLRTVVGQATNAPLGIELPGRVVVNPASSIMVQATYRGFLEKANNQFPFVGQQVKKGQLLAKLKPINNHLEEAQIRERITELTNEIELDRKRMAMLNEVVYIRYRVNKIEEIRTEIQGLIRRVSVLEDSLRKTYELRAQTDGVISEVGASAGEHVEEGTTLFRIIDPRMLWVEASGYEQGLQNSIQSANALTIDGSSIDLEFVGGGLSLSNQAIPLLFEVISTDASALSIGNPVTVFVRTKDSEAEGIAIPRSGLVRDTDGSTLVWKKISAELFQKIRVAVVPIDAEHVLVEGDLLPNDRVVSSGVGVLAQIR
jgi:hypothetical protein